jgi:hypothetical protein
MALAEANAERPAGVDRMAELQTDADRSDASDVGSAEANDATNRI